MKLSSTTLTILKNFSEIDTKMLIVPGNVLKAKTSAVYAEAVVEENFPREAGIFNIPNFLNVIALFEDPDIEFCDDYIKIVETNGKAETLYGYAGAGMVTLQHPKKKRELPTEVVEFTLTEEQWGKIQKAISILQTPEMKIISNGKTVRLSTSDHTKKAGNYFSMVLDADPHGISCSIIFEKDHMHLLKGSYTGMITPAFTVFKNTSGFDLTYYVGCEPTASTFGEQSAGA